MGELRCHPPRGLNATLHSPGAPRPPMPRPCPLEHTTTTTHATYALARSPTTSNKPPDRGPTTSSPSRLRAMIRKKQTAQRQDPTEPARLRQTRKTKKKGAKRRGSAAEPLPKRRYRPDTKALRDIRRFQRTTELLIPKLPFQRLVRELAANYVNGLRFIATAVEALQEACEAYLVLLFEDSVLCADHANRATIQRRDMRLSIRIRGGNGARC